MIAYFNCSAGISGDMVLASFINAGIGPDYLEKSIKRALSLGGWNISTKKVRIGHTLATQVRINGKRQFSETSVLKKIISKSKLPGAVKTNSLKIIERLITTESKIHKTSKSKVHFHEMASIDTLIDVVGAALCFYIFEISEAFCSSLNLGNPAPATLEIVKSHKLPVYTSTPEYELTTPTGAAIVSVLMKPADTSPVMKVEKFGFGAGSFKVPGNPNLLKLLIGKSLNEVILLETNIDDMDPRVYPYVMDKLLKAGALDVWLTNVIMKKGRPGIVFSVLCKTENEQKITDIIFRETTTLGIRRFPLTRHVLPRKKGDASIKHKTAILPDGSKKVSVEFSEAIKRAIKPGSPALYQILKKP